MSHGRSGYHHYGSYHHHVPYHHVPCPSSVCVGKPDSKVQNAQSLEQCKSLCEQDPHCNTTVYNPDTNVCRQYEHCPKRTFFHTDCHSQMWEKH